MESNNNRNNTSSIRSLPPPHWDELALPLLPVAQTTTQSNATGRRCPNSAAGRRPHRSIVPSSPSPRPRLPPPLPRCHGPLLFLTAGGPFLPHSHQPFPSSRLAPLPILASGTPSSSSTQSASRLPRGQSEFAPRHKGGGRTTGLRWCPTSPVMDGRCDDLG